MHVAAHRPSPPDILAKFAAMCPVDKLDSVTASTQCTALHLAVASGDKHDFVEALCVVQCVAGRHIFVYSM